MAKKTQQIAKGTAFGSAGLELISAEEVWSLDPQTFFEKMFHCFKQENHFIGRSFDQVAIRDLVDLVNSGGVVYAKEPIIEVFRDYHDNTQARLLKYGKNGLIQFTNFYKALLEENAIEVPTN